MKTKVFLSLISLLILSNFHAQLASQQAISNVSLSNSISNESPVKWARESYGEWDPSKEEVSLRDQNSKHFKNDDGSYAAIIAAGNLHYWENNRWNTIFHSIDQSANGFTNVTNSHKTYYPANASNSLMTVLPDGSEIKDMIAMRMFFEVDGLESNSQNILGSTGIVDFNRLTYSNVYGSGIDLRFIQETTKRKMDYIIANINALGFVPAQANYLVFEEKVELPTGWTAHLEENVIYVKDNAGVVRAIYEKPEFKDAPQLDNDGHYHSDEAEGIYNLLQQGNELTIQTKVQLSWLMDPQRSFPVTIDPTVNLYPNNTAWWTGQIDAYHSNSSTAADAPLYSASTFVDDFNDVIYLGRYDYNYSMHGWAKFNITSLPNSCVNSVNLNYRVYDNFSGDATCGLMGRLRHLANDPVAVTGSTLLDDIRDGDIYEVRDFRTFTTGTGWVNAPMTANIDELENSIPSGWFGVGFHNYQGGPHMDCFTGIYGYSSASRPYLVVNYTPFYQVQFSSPTPTSFCAGQTQNVSVTVTNTGCRTWTSGWTLPNTVNFSWWGSWQAGGLAGGQDNNPRLTPFVSLAPGASQVVTFSVTAPSTPGSYTIQTDLVRDAVCWFRNNGAPDCGPGNVNYTIPITVYDALTVNAGSDVSSCSGGNINLSGSITPSTYSSSASATYTAGNASSLYNTAPTTATNSTCPINLTVNIPAGATITSVNVSYSMIAQGGGYMSEQRTYLQCTNAGGVKEGSIYSGSGSSGGTQNYSRTGLTIANGVVGGGAINFSLHAFRTWGGSGCNTTYNYVNNNSFTITVYYTVPIPVVWSGGPIVSGANSLTPTVNPTTTTTYTLTATSIGCSNTDQVAITISPLSSPPTSVSATHPLHPNYCHGNTINLTSVGGTAAGGSIVDVWYENSCNTTVEETWSTTPIGRPGWWTGSTTVNSANGILNVTSTGVDPMIYMGNLSINPNIYRYVQVRYRYVSGPTNSGMQVFFENGSGLAEARSQRGTMIMDGAWHYLNLDMSVNYSGVNSGWVGGPTVTGLRFDFCEATGMVMEFDFLLVSQNRMVGDQTTLSLPPSSPYYPTVSTQYYTRKIDNCGASTCASTNVVLPPMGTTLALDNEAATCYVYANETIRYYHSSGRYIASVTAGGTTLGSTIATNYLEPDYLLVPACDMSSLELAVMQRHWVITPTTNGTATVRLPYYTSELANLGTGSIISTSPYDLIISPDNSNLKLSKYSGGVFPATTNVNDSPYDNCVVDGTTLHDNVGIGSNTPVANINAMYSDFTIPGFSEFWLHGNSNNSPLPITLSSFTAVCNDSGDEVKVHWSTASENNTSHFEVEKSLDGITWEVLGTANAAGNSNVTLTYELSDKDVRGLDVIYYRLNQFDQDGESETYGMATSECLSNRNGFELFPNPAGTEVTILLTGSDYAEDRTAIVFYDLHGKELERIEYKESAGKLMSVDLRSFETGVYLVRLINGDKNDEFIRLIKQ